MRAQILLGDDEERTEATIKILVKYLRVYHTSAHILKPKNSDFKQEIHIPFDFGTICDEATMS